MSMEGRTRSDPNPPPGRRVSGAGVGPLLGVLAVRVLPYGVSARDRTREFTGGTIPAGLSRSCRTRGGIVILEGRLCLSIPKPDPGFLELAECSGRDVYDTDPCRVEGSRKSCVVRSER